MTGKAWVDVPLNEDPAAMPAARRTHVIVPLALGGLMAAIAPTLAGASMGPIPAWPGADPEPLRLAALLAPCLAIGFFMGLLTRSPRLAALPVLAMSAVLVLVVRRLAGGSPADGIEVLGELAACGLAAGWALAWMSVAYVVGYLAGSAFRPTRRARGA